MKKNKTEKYLRIADMGENAASNFVNYGVKKKHEGRYAVKRALLIALYILLPLTVAGVFMYMKILPILATLPVFIWMLVFFTWRYVSVEYEYYILDGEFRMLEVYGSKSMRELCRTRVSAMTVIAPYDYAHRLEIDTVPEERRIKAVSTMSAPDIYYAIYKDEDGNKCAVFFEAIEKTLKALRYYNTETVVVKTRK